MGRRHAVLGVALLCCAACTSTIAGSGRATLPASPRVVCAAGACRLAAKHDLGSGFVISVYGDTSAFAGAGAAAVVVTRRGARVYWRVFRGETPAQLACGSAGVLRNCVLVDYTGAHAAVGYPITLVRPGIRIGDPVTTDTPVMRARDLDGDGGVDVYGLQNDYHPSYADGAVQWQTWRRSADATTLISTGCGPLGTRRPPPRAPLAGACAP